MKAWHFNEPEKKIQFDFTADFDSQVKHLKSVNGGHFHMHGHNYYVLRAMFEGHTIDDYENPPRNDKGLGIRNVRSRIAELRTEWNIRIGDRTKEGKQYKEYIISGREDGTV